VSMNGKVIIRDNYEDLAEIAIEKAEAVRKERPFSPVYLLLRSNLVGVQLKRRMADRMGGIFNVRFLTFPDLLDRMESSGQRRDSVKLPQEAGSLIIEKMKAEGSIPAYFREISSTAGFPDAILRSMTDLSESGLDRSLAEQISGSGGYSSLPERLRSVISMFIRFRGDIQLEGEDIHSRFREAANCPTPLDGPLIGFGFYDFNELQIRLLSSIASAGRVELLMAGGQDNGFGEDVLRRLEEEGFELESPAAGIKQKGEVVDRVLIETINDEREAGEIVRMVLKTVSENDFMFRDIGIVYPSADCFPPLIEALEEAGVPYYSSGTSAAELNWKLRSVDLLLDLLTGEINRRDLVEFMLLAPLDIPSGFNPDFNPFDMWVRITAEEGMTGEDGWDKENAEFISTLRGRMDSSENQKKLTAAVIVEDILKRVREAGEALEGEFRWEEISAEISLLASEIFTDHMDVKDIFSTGLEKCSPPVTLEAFNRIFRKIIRRKNTTMGRFLHDGVNLLSLQQLRGLSFPVLFLAGLVQDKLPGRVRQDPFLKDGEREELNRLSGGAVFLQKKMARYHEIELIFSLAMRSAQQRLICSLALFEGGDGKKRIRSYLLDLFRAEAREAGSEIREVKVSGEEPPSLYMSLDEYIFYKTLEFRSTGKGGLPARSFFDRAAAALEGRMNTPEFTPWDGVFGSTDGLEAVAARLRGRLFSATFLQSYSRCPFAFFMKYLLEAETVEDPERKITIDPMEKGLLIHKILEKSYLKFLEEGLLPLRSGDSSEIMGILKETGAQEFEAFERNKTVGLDFLWRISGKEIFDRITGFLMNEAGSDDPFIPANFEKRFGHEEDRVIISLSVSGRDIPIEGKIDRIDLGPDGTFRIIDYKSSIPAGAKSNDFSAGDNIQLPLYLLGASGILDSTVSRGEAQFREVSWNTGKPVIFEGGELQKKMEEFDRILETVLSGIENGLFFCVPGDRSCKYCDFKQACPASRERLFKRKIRYDYRAKSYRDLKSKKE